MTRSLKLLMNNKSGSKHQVLQRVRQAVHSPICKENDIEQIIAQHKSKKFWNEVKTILNVDLLKIEDRVLEVNIRNFILKIPA